MKKYILFYLFLTLFQSTAQAQVCQVIVSHVITGNQVQYYGTSPDNPTAWSWFFNGGSPMTSSLQNPVVTYAAPGTYISALSVSGGPNSCSASLSNKQDTVTILTTGIQEKPVKDGVRQLTSGPTPTFEISSIRDQQVTIQLFDAGGNLIDVIFKGLLRQGINTLQLEAYGLKGGSYILSINGVQASFSTKFFWKE